MNIEKKITYSISELSEEEYKEIIALHQNAVSTNTATPKQHEILSSLSQNI